MYKLKFDEGVCGTCETTDCLARCQYMELGADEAHEEMMKVVRGEDSRVLRECMTCYACEEYCNKGNHPFYLITERREEKGILTAPRPITNQWINMCEPQGKFAVGEIGETALSCCFIGELRTLGQGPLFEEVAPSFAMGAEFMCPAVYLHYAKPSVIKERLPRVLENFQKLGAKEVLCLHDECYGTYTSIAPAYGMEVPFTPIHYMDHLYQRLLERKSEIQPLGIKAAYQRPCSSRFSSDKHALAAKILALIGVEVLEREYQGENSLCCGEILRSVAGYRLANDVQKRNVDDMAASGAEYCVFNCPYCQIALSEKVTKRNIQPMHIVDLCKRAIAGGKKAEVR